MSSTQLLVSTSKKLILYDGHPHVIQQDYGLYYGITWGFDYIYVVSRMAHPHRVQTFDSNLNVVGHVPFKGMGIDPHQALYHDGTLYVANRDHKCIQAWDFPTRSEHVIIPSTRDNHYNSVWWHSGLFWIVEHRQTRMPKKIKVFDSTWQQLATFSIWLKEQLEIGTGMHNVYVEGNAIFTLAPDQIIVVVCSDLQAGFNVHKQITLNLPGINAKEHYLRGLARTVDHFYIGVSNWTTRSQRGEGDSWILVLDNDLNIVKRITLPDTGQITEIRVLDGDLAHNGLRCPYGA